MPTSSSCPSTSQSAPTASEPVELRSLRGLVATVVLGQIEPDFAEHRELMHSHADRTGFTNVEWRTFPAALVEAGRDAVCEHALKERYEWLLMIDADAAPIPVNALEAVLHTAFVLVPDSDAVGGYCQLKGGGIPTIDTGTGTWEEHYPGEGVIPVIRTGAHFLLVKTSALRKFGPPWFRTRRTLRPIDALAEVDNYAHCKTGRNPFQSPEWEFLIENAKRESGAGPSSVGEDSGFCDALIAAGGKVYVNSDLVVGHIERHSILPADLARKARERERQLKLACGVM